MLAKCGLFVSAAEDTNSVLTSSFSQHLTFFRYTATQGMPGIQTGEWVGVSVLH